MSSLLSKQLFFAVRFVTFRYVDLFVLLLYKGVTIVVSIGRMLDEVVVCVVPIVVTVQLQTRSFLHETIKREPIPKKIKIFFMLWV